MRFLQQCAFGPRAGAVAAALLVAAAGIASIGPTQAQYDQQNPRAQKKAPPPGKGAVQPQRRNMGQPGAVPGGRVGMPPGAGPNRIGMPPRGQALGPNAPQGPSGPG